MFPLNAPPDKAVIEEIAIELGVHPSFIEKDWYAVRTLGMIRGIEDKCMPVFSGGTSLSKGYGLIERFSEDLDFKVAFPGGTTRDDFRTFREKTYEAIAGNPDGLKIIEASKFSRNESRFFGCSLEYPQTFAPQGSIRPHVKLEFSFRPPFTGPESREIRSFVTQFRKGAPDLEIGCIRPIETAADKLSAFIWRVLKRDRSARGDDPALIRHLHDLAMLEKRIMEEKAEFWRIAEQAYALDLEERASKNSSETLIGGFDKLIAALKVDPLYAEEYKKFVSGVSYATEDRHIGYVQALAALERIRASRET